MTADVVAFLRAALDEVERVAGAASYDGTWTDAGDWDTARVEDSQRRRLARVHPEADARHIALHDPRAALARVQAEKRLVDECRRVLSEGWPRVMPGIGYMEDTVRLLAYGHRYTVPGYDPAWAPEGVSADA